MKREKGLASRHKGCETKDEHQEMREDRRGMTNKKIRVGKIGLKKNAVFALTKFAKKITVTFETR